VPLAVVQQNLVDVGIVPAFGEDDVEITVAVQITHAGVCRRIRCRFEWNRYRKAGKHRRILRGCGSDDEGEEAGERAHAKDL